MLRSPRPHPAATRGLAVLIDAVGLAVQLLRHAVSGLQPNHLRQDPVARSVKELGGQVRVVRVGHDLPGVRLVARLGATARESPDV
eukprot:10832088-Heterocapsa_arctica.AAC.1